MGVLVSEVPYCSIATEYGSSVWRYDGTTGRDTKYTRLYYGRGILK